MGIHLTSLEEIDDHLITEEEAGKVYRILEANTERGWMITSSIEAWNERWQAGESSEELARAAVKMLYRWHEKLMLFYGEHATPEMCLDAYAAVGIEPPEPPERTGEAGHGN